MPKPLDQALQALNAAAYDALAASLKHKTHDDADRAALRQIAGRTDKLVDDFAIAAALDTITVGRG